MALIHNNSEADLGSRRLHLIGLFVLSTFPLASVQAGPLTRDETTLFVQDCESLLFQRLSDPASYERISFDPIVFDGGSMEDFMGVETPEKAARVATAEAEDAELKSLHRQLAGYFTMGIYQRASTVINYTAKGEGGTVSGQKVTCSAYLGKSSSYTFPSPNMRIDGYSTTEWAIRSGDEVAAQSRAILSTD